MNQMVAPHGHWVSLITRARAADDRRRFTRYEGNGLMVAIDRVLRPVDDVSVAGLRVTGVSLAKGTRLRLQVIPRRGDTLAVNEAVWTDVLAVGGGADHVRLRFSTATFSLIKLIVRHIGERVGVQPFMVR